MTAVLFPLRVRQAADGLHGRLSRRLVPGDQRGFVQSLTIAGGLIIHSLVHAPRKSVS